MANAIVTESVTGSTYTYTQLVAALKTALTNAGFSASPYVDQSSNTAARFWVYKVPIDSDQTKARANMYLRVKILDIQNNPSVWRIQFRLYYEFSNSTNTGNIYSWGEEAGIDIPQAPTSSMPIIFTAIKHAEAKILVINQLSNFGYLSFFTPLNKIDGWDFDNVNYCAAFIGAKDLSCLRQPAGYAPVDDESGNSYNYHTLSQKANPYASTNDIGDFYIENFGGRLANRRATTQKYQLIPNFIILSGTSEGAVAYSSNDLAIVGANNLTPLTRLSDGSKNYLLAIPAAENSALAIAVA